MVDKNEQKILITGANGMVGSYINFGIKTDIDTLNILDQIAVEKAFDKYRPEVVIHLAAETDVDLCQREPSHGYKINTFGTYNIAAAAKNFNTKMVYISTKAVFEGKKDELHSEKDLPNPQNIYGRTKYLGEIIVKDIVPEYLIIRAGWMFGGGPKKDKKFVGKIMKQLNLPEIKAVNDKIDSTTFGKDLIKGIQILLKENRTGIYHLVNKGFTSYYDVACEIKRLLKSPVKIIPVSSDYFNLAAPRSSETLSSKIDIMRPWQEALKEYLLTEWKDYL
jgi:dTDP-4-dehydrorhamnose reductase